MNPKAKADTWEDVPCPECGSPKRYQQIENGLMVVRCADCDFKTHESANITFGVSHKCRHCGSTNRVYTYQTRTTQCDGCKAKMPNPKDNLEALHYYEPVDLGKETGDAEQPKTVTGIPICSNCYPEPPPKNYNPENAFYETIGDEFAVHCKKCNRVVFWER